MFHGHPTELLRILFDGSRQPDARRELNYCKNQWNHEFGGILLEASNTSTGSFARTEGR